MQGNKFCSEYVDCPVCSARAGEQCGVIVQGDIAIHIERARQSRWLQMYQQSSASKFASVFDEAFTELQ